jgi:hypothetical protein
MSVISNITECRICKNANLRNVISLGEQMITSRFPLYGDNSTPKTPIDLCMCQQCGLLQLLQTTFSNELYEYEYGYRSGISNTMREHLKKYNEEILSKITLNSGDTIVDIGSNDSTMLQYYSNAYNRIGVDPTGKQFANFYGDVKLLPTYFNYENCYTEPKTIVELTLEIERAFFHMKGNATYVHSKDFEKNKFSETISSLLV